MIVVLIVRPLLIGHLKKPWAQAQKLGWNSRDSFVFKFAN
jgi:hypothetical protein